MIRQRCIQTLWGGQELKIWLRESPWLFGKKKENEAESLYVIAESKKEITRYYNSREIGRRYWKRVYKVLSRWFTDRVDKSVSPTKCIVRWQSKAGAPMVMTIPKKLGLLSNWTSLIKYKFKEKIQRENHQGIHGPAMAGY